VQALNIYRLSTGKIVSEVGGRSESSGNSNTAR
jgi:hypothetical protein